MVVRRRSVRTKPSPRLFEYRVQTGGLHMKLAKRALFSSASHDVQAIPGRNGVLVGDVKGTTVPVGRYPTGSGDSRCLERLGRGWTNERGKPVKPGVARRGQIDTPNLIDTVAIQRPIGLQALGQCLPASKPGYGASGVPQKPRRGRLSGGFS